MEHANKTLRNGMSLVVFPEGARSWDGKMRNFKRGAFKLALDFNLPIVPITINGSFDTMPRFTYIIKQATEIVLTIHRPILPSEEGHNLENVTEECYDVIHSGVVEKYQ